MPVRQAARTRLGSDVTGEVQPQSPADRQGVVYVSLPGVLGSPILLEEVALQARRTSVSHSSRLTVDGSCPAILTRQTVKRLAASLGQASSAILRSSRSRSRSVRPSRVSSSPRTLGSRWELERLPAATRSSTRGSAAAGPWATEIATALLSSTTGEGASRPSAS